MEKGNVLIFLSRPKKTNVRLFCCDDRCQRILVVPSALSPEPARNAQRTLRSVRDGPGGGRRHFPRRIRPQPRNAEGMFYLYGLVPFALSLYVQWRRRRRRSFNLSEKLSIFAELELDTSRVFQFETFFFFERVIALHYGGDVKPRRLRSLDDP